MAKMAKNGQNGQNYLHKNDLYHGHVGCPLKKHQKCSTEQKTRGQNVDPIKNYSQNTFVWIFPLINHNVSHKKIRITISNDARAKTKTVLRSLAHLY